MYDFIIIGGGIIGLSTALHLTKAYPGKRILVLEKEASLSYHQTGHNSGVIHTGVYYKPGGMKARFCQQGAQSMPAFCDEHGIRYETCGKVIVAVREAELPWFKNLHQRGLENGVKIKEISLEALKEIEPHVKAIKALHVPDTGIVDYVDVSNKYADLIREAGGEIKLNTKVVDIKETKQEAIVKTTQGEFKARYVIGCAGLQSDRIAKKAHAELDFRIVPFRGEYYDIKPDKKHLVKNLIYPVPDPSFPFLGVHFSRHIDGRVSIGPNAVLNCEGYQKLNINLKDLGNTLSYAGFWRLIGQYIKPGTGEMMRSLFKPLFLKRVQQYMPEITSKDITVSHCGIRAQALGAKGQLLQDFNIARSVKGRSLHVCNAPSPAATSSLQIGEYIVKKIQAEPLDL